MGEKVMKSKGILNKPNPDVSILIPVFNCEQFLEESLESCAKQDFGGVIEAVVVDDGSTDNTAALLSQLEKRFSADKFSINIYRQVNKGVSAARNKAISLSRGEKILFLDGDDAFVPQTVRRCVEVLEANPDTAFVYSGTVRCDEMLNRISINHKMKFDLQKLFSHFYIGQVRAFHRRVLQEVGGFDESRFICEDFDHVLRIVLDGRSTEPVHIPEALYRYRKNPLSLTNTAGFARREESRLVIQAYFDRLGIAAKVPAYEKCPDGKYRINYPLDIQNSLEQALSNITVGAGL